MRIALIGYGRMGRLVKATAEHKGHEINVMVNEVHAGLPSEQLAETLRAADVAIDFSSAKAVSRNVEGCLLAEIPIVEGTTGWNDQRDDIEALVKGRGGTILIGANFSVGVNLYFKVAAYAAGLFARFPEYEAFIEEQHHSKKKDAPSGTALKLKEIVEQFVPVTGIVATRAGNIPGTHRVGFDGRGDQILFEHSARSRECFADGALMAAEWVVGKKGVYEFADVIDEIVGISEL